MPDPTTIEQWETENPDPVETPSPAPAAPAAAPPPETPQVEAPPAVTLPATPSPRYGFDDILPDDPRLPESFRGKPLNVLVEDRLRADKEAKQAGFQKNAERERAEAYKAALEILAKQMEGPGDRAPRPAPKPSETMRQRGVDPASVYSDPAAFVDASTEVARQAIMPEVQREASVVNQRVLAIEQRLMEQGIRDAFNNARPEKISKADWNADAPVISAYIVAHNKDVLNSGSYQEASNWLEETRSRKSAPSRPAPAAPLPAAPAPPVGNGTTAPVATKPQARVSSHVRGAFNDVVETLNSIGVKTTTDAILDGMSKEAKYKEMFE